MGGGQRLAVHVVGKQGLRMYRDVALDGNIIPAVRRLEADVLRNTTCLFPRIKLIVAAVEWRECGGEVAQARPPPLNNLAPTPPTIKFCNQLHPPELLLIPPCEEPPRSTPLPLFPSLPSTTP